MFAAGQIVDRPTADLRPRFHWGVIGSFIPHWSIPGNMGNLFFENQWNSPKMSGRDIRIGVVRGRQLGFEMGVSFVRKTVTSVDIRDADEEFAALSGSVSSTALEPVAHDGRRRAPGDPVRAHRRTGTARVPRRRRSGLDSRDADPGANRGTAVLCEPGLHRRVDHTARDRRLRWTEQSARSGHDFGIAESPLYAVSPTDKFWMLLRAQLAADFLLAPPLKVRLAAGFHFPGTQALGVDVVYLFRTDASARRRRSRILRPQRHPPLKSRTGRR